MLHTADTRRTLPRPSNKTWRLLWAGLVLAAPAGAGAVEPRAVIPRAESEVTIDGKLSEYANAFGAPLEYFHFDQKNRPAQFFFLWDDEAFYVAVRTLDEKRYSQEHPLWEGDAVEFYFDARRGEDFRNQVWGKGSVHCFFTPMDLDRVAPRFCLRPGYEDAIEEIGIEVAAQETDGGLEVEFKLPWANFPDFEAQPGAVLGLDTELSYSDGGPRSDRSFLFASPLNVQQPGTLALVELVEEFRPEHWESCGPILLPVRIDTPWGQAGAPQVEALAALPPNRADDIAKVVFQTIDLHGNVIGEHEASERQVIDARGGFERLRATWPADEADPGRFNIVAVAYDSAGKELTRCAPRMVSVNIWPGY